ncbi:MAG: GNAT family N-acetyltransferase [Chloroflexi bacterium]|nr:GNAT family N-acetyltransferase [Chloroflexota bacterium]
MSVLIRRADPDDIYAIANIAASALAVGVNADAPWLRQRITGGLTLVADRRDEVVGFVDAFFTSDRSGRRRLELDLLAVAASSRGRGIGGQLLAKCLAIAADSDAREIRALVRSQNEAMQRLCGRHGFCRSPVSYDLYIAEPKPGAREMQSHEASLIPVETLAYRGVWLEGTLSQNAIDAAHLIARRQEASRLGALISAAERPSAQLLRLNFFVNVGAYHWWTFSLESD